MKKIYGILVATGILLAMIPVTAIADDPVQDYIKESVILEEVVYKNIKKKSLGRPEKIIQSNENKKHIIARGIWGYVGDNESDGYFGGKISRRGRFGIFKGIYNTTANVGRTRFVFLMKNGYFNGVILNNESKYIIVGLYIVNKENYTIKMRWMTTQQNGWAIARLKHPS